ncbi:ATP-binding protein [Blastococcus sp. TF02A_35]|uniref:GAF domain-containing sensor histidine kinase n=1 Tax=Blastococcus sp. TF02A-35 TaxID=2559612 RepID=UPI0010740D34|nr:ATP-binding protein [Blastococcus sp. TF02A_35]TFV51997.1 histidine kinase [Blastococcus sp. TF02A_35]
MTDGRATPAAPGPLEATLRRLAEAAAEHLGGDHVALTARSADDEPERSVTLGAAGAGAPAPSHALELQLRADDAVLAALRVARAAGAPAFTPADRARGAAFAAGAAPAVENALLVEHARLRRRWALAGTEIASALLSGRPADQVLREAAARVAELAGADAVGVLVPEPDDDTTLRITAAVGPTAAELEGVRLPLGETRLHAAHRSGVPLLIDDAATPPPGTRLDEVVDAIARWYGPALFIPLGGPAPLSTLTVMRMRGRPPFDRRVLDLAAAFATQATVAMELARSQERERRLQLQADRDRIARDLHDHVVQRIFATALALDRVGRSLEATAPEVAERIAERVDELDGTIARIRASIFELHGAEDASPDAVRRRLTEIVRSVTEGHGLRPALRVHNEVEDLPPDLVPDVVAVVRELVTNVVRHAAASRLTVTVAIADGVRVVVTDDGCGLPPVTVRSGLANLADRAERRGGRLAVSAAPSGTEIEWAVPLPR